MRRSRPPRAPLRRATSRGAARATGRLALAGALFVGLASLSGCASFPGVPTGSGAKPLKPLSIMFSSNRYGEIETCQCVVGQLGGIDREGNLRAKWQGATEGTFLALAGGTTFVPAPADAKPKRKPHWLVKAPFIVDALNSLGFQALSPSAEDLTLGLEEMERLRARAKFPFVSANLVSSATGKPLFEPFLELSHDGMDIVVTGLSATPAPAYPLPPQAKVLPPREALAQVFTKVRPAKAFVIVLSSLPAPEREKIQNEFPDVNLILGAALDATATFSVRQWTGKSLYFHPMGQGRALSLIEFDMRSLLVGFFNPSVAANIRDTRRIYVERVADLHAKLEGKRDGPERRELEAKKAELLAFLGRTETVPLELAPDTIPYRSTTTELDDNYALPRNDLTKLLEAYRAAVRKAALRREKNALELEP